MGGEMTPEDRSAGLFAPTHGWSLETLRVYVDTKLEGIGTRLQATDDARALQAVEYKRRLDDLNGEHGRLDRAQATYVRNDIYEKDREENRKTILLLTDKAEQARRSAVVAWTGLAVAIVGWILTGAGLWLSRAM